jgi:NDP-mannose synthase
MHRKEKVVILAGGKGTRLKPFTANFPKPLVPVGDMPILEILLRQLLRQGFSDVTLTVGHLADLVRAYFAQHKSFTRDMNIRFVDEESPTGTAGSLAHVPGLDGTFLVMNGDVLTNIDFTSLIEFHKNSGAILTIAVHRQHVKIDLGVLEMDDRGRLIDYIEKPERMYDVSMGIYVYEPEILKYIEKGTYLDFPTLVLHLLQEGMHVQAYRSDAFWLDIGRPDDYAKAQEIFEREKERFGI